MALDFLAGTRVVEEKDSSINGKIRVIKSLGFGTYIQVENLTQSGGVVYDVWRTTLRTVNRQQLAINNCLILGLGGGSAALLAKKFWPKAEITGVDIDPVMVEMGKKYLGLKDVNVVIEDAMKFVIKTKEKYDVVLIDLYIGYEVPEKFKTDKFLRLVDKLLTGRGIAVFNRLYFGEKRLEATRFGEKLKKVFTKVEYVFPEANIMFLCSR